MHDEVLWVVVSLGEELYALPAEDVDAMVLMPSVSDVPNTPSEVRGVFILRERTLPVLDLRVRLGMSSLAEDTDALIELLTAREADHVNWLNQLEASVAEGTLFTLTTDPHACAFGKWYDSYETDNLLVAGLLKKFDAPHKRIHGIADQIVALEKSGDIEAARALIERTREGDLAEMIKLFDRLRTQILDSLREIAIVVNVDGRPYAVAVDGVETVSRLSEADVDAVSDALSQAENEMVAGVRCLDKTGSLVICLRTAQVLPAA